MAEYGFKPDFIPSAPSDPFHNHSQLQHPYPPHHNNFPPPPFPHQDNLPAMPPYSPPQAGYPPPPHGSFPPPPHQDFYPGPPRYPTEFPPIRPEDDSKFRAYYWVDTHARGGVPSTAIHGGVDIDGEQIYVGRAYHEGDWIPAKVIPGKSVAYVAYNGLEHAKEHFQVLCEQRFDWLHEEGGRVPPGAVEGGKTEDGEPLYIGRVYHEGSQTVGKIHPSHGVCYIPFDGREIAYPNYEVLTLRP